jgi:hydrogenase maturation protease
MSVLVVGVGSPFGDDRVGWEVVAALEEALRSGLQLPVAVRTCALDRPGAALIDALRDAHHAVIVDACAAGSAAGSLCWLDEHALEAAPSASSHGFGLAQALALARAIGATPDRVDVLAVSGAQFDGDTLSDAVRAAVPAAVQSIRALLLDASTA